MKTRIKLLVCFLALFAVISCIPLQKYNDLKDKKQKTDKERDRLKSMNDSLTTRINEMTAEIEKLKKLINPLIDDTTIRGRAYRTLTSQYNQVEAQYELLYKNFERLKKEHDDQEKKISNKLFNTQDDLLKKEDDLKKLDISLQEQKNKLETMKRDLDNKDLELKTKDAELKKQSNLLDEKNKKLSELQGILNRKDSVVKSLKDKVTNALMGFENDGLTIQQKNGKVYVSLDEKLLFKPAKWDVDPKGQSALKKLSKVLEQNPDINVMIEGHTDNVPLNGKTAIVDNWDLSVKRATAIVKIILKEAPNIDAKRLIASGRGEFCPIDNASTPNARQKNRRTEIILTPKLDELFKILENN
ncbi:MAG: OmpA family protein [Bacteroidia bacterium]|nr:OmpA family protein [Bacteroidia bacterium]